MLKPIGDIMFVLALYSHDVPTFYVNSPDAGDDIVSSLDAIVYTSIPKLKLNLGFLNNGATVFLYRYSHYVLALLTDKDRIIGFYKDVFPELWAALIPYEGQDPKYVIRPYGIWLIEKLDKAYLYIPRRALRDQARLYKRVVADLGHEAFAIRFEDKTVIFNRKGVLFGEGTFSEAIEDEITENVLRLADEFGKNPISLVLQTNPWTAVEITLRAQLGRPTPWPRNGADMEYIGLFG